MNDCLTVAVLITCFNRREKTLGCISALLKSTVQNKVGFKIILVDDGSPDGTGSAVSSEYPEVDVIYGNGSLFWNGGMYKAFAEALSRGYDAYLWLNDDTLLYEYGLDVLISSWLSDRQKGLQGIYVGSTRDPISGALTYGGVTRTSPLKPLGFTFVHPTDQCVLCHTFNGNCVLIPDEVARSVGNLDASFAHAMGDTDYGLRAEKIGIKSWVVPGFVGVCSRNGIEGTFQDPSLPRLVRLRKMLQPKGLPIKSWYVITRRHGGILWPLYFLWPYFKKMVAK